MEHSTPNKLPKLNYKDRSIDIVCPSSEKMTLSRDALQKKGRRLINLLFLGVTRQAAGLLVGWTEQRPPRPVEQDADNENDVKTGKLRETDNNNTNQQLSCYNHVPALCRGGRNDNRIKFCAKHQPPDRVDDIMMETTPSLHLFTAKVWSKGCFSLC